MLKNSIIFPELKGAVLGFALILILEALLYPYRMLWTRFLTPIPVYVLVAFVKALFLGVPLGWNSWAAWREWRLQRFAGCKVRLRLVGWILLLVQLGIAGLQMSWVNLWREMRGDLPHAFLFYALNASLLWAILLVLISFFLPRTERQKVQITQNLRL